MAVPIHRNIGVGIDIYCDEREVIRSNGARKFLWPLPDICVSESGLNCSAGGVYVRLVVILTPLRSQDVSVLDPDASLTSRPLRHSWFRYVSLNLLSAETIRHFL